MYPASIITNLTSKLHVSYYYRYENQVKESLEYFESLRQVQLQRSGENAAKTFLAPETWRNLRITCRGFFAYCREMIVRADQYQKLGKIKNFYCVSPAHSNSSPIEAWFSVVRGSRQDSATTYASMLAGREMNKAQASATLKNNKMYMATHIGGIDLGKEIGPTELINFHKHREKQMKDMIAECAPSNHQPAAAYSPVNLPASLLNCEKDSMLILLQKQLPNGYVPELLKQEYFQQCIRLSIDRPTEGWFKELLAIVQLPSDRKMLEEACQKIQDKLFQMSLNALQRRKSNSVSYEYDMHSYHRSPEFHNFCINSLPGTLFREHSCCALLFLALNRLHAGWVREALIEARKKRDPAMFRKKSTTALTTEQENNAVNRFVGWGADSTMKLKRFEDDGTAANKECRKLLSSMILRSRDMDDEYVEKYYDMHMTLLNRGGLTLISKPFFEWAKLLLKLIRTVFTVDTIDLDPKGSFEKAKTSITTHNSLKAHFMFICKKYSLASPKRANEVYPILVEKIFHARAGPVFRRWKELNVKKNGVALRPKLKAASSLSSSERPSKRLKVSEDNSWSDMTVDDLKKALRERELTVSGLKADLVDRLKKYQKEDVASCIAACEEYGLKVSGKDDQLEDDVTEDGMVDDSVPEEDMDMDMEGCM